MKTGHTVLSCDSPLVLLGRVGTGIVGYSTTIKEAKLLLEEVTSLLRDNEYMNKQPYN